MTVHDGSENFYAAKEAKIKMETFADSYFESCKLSEQGFNIEGNNSKMHKKYGIKLGINNKNQICVDKGNRKN